jgi:nicotinate-nucleotide adenylyltransferase
MLQLAITQEPALEVSSYELEQGGTSYSLKTALHFQQLYPTTALYWIVGADQFAQLARWHAIEQLLQVVRFLVCRRPGYSVQPPALPGLRYQFLELEESDCSSTEIRKRCKMGQPIAELTSKQVEAFISARALYTL